MEIIIHQAILHVLDTTMDAPVLSGSGMEMAAEKTAYFQYHIEKLLASDDIRQCRPLPDSAFKNELEHNKDFVDLSCRIAGVLFDYMHAHTTIPGADLAVVDFTRDGEPWLGILKLNYKNGYTHYTENVDGAPVNSIIQQRACLPSQSGKVEEGALVNLTDYSMKLLEKKFDIDGRKEFYLSTVVFQYTTAQPEKKKLQAIQEAAVQAVQENYALYDGFIICHGTDTLAYSAAALSYLIQNADKPIILTGAQQPISNEITDAKKNLRDSVICALDPGSRGVMVVFGGHVIAGTRAKKNKTISYDAFASVNFPELALVQGDRLVRYIPSPWPTGPVEFGRALDPKVFLLKLTPGMSPDLIPEIFRLYDCVIVESFGVGGIPQQLMDAFAEGLGDYDKTRKVLILTTQVTYEGSDVGVYEVGKRVKNRFRFLEAHDMTIEAVVTKSMWLLAQNCESFDQLQQRFYRQVNFDTFYH